MTYDLEPQAGQAVAVAAPWCSYHLVYHGNRDHALGALIAPLVRSLWAEQEIDRFFFIRYSLGGPHLRLRLRVRFGRENAVSRRVLSAATEFFDRFPSTVTLDPEQTRRVNRSILDHDAHEKEDVVFPDNSVQEVPFRPEVERYGGPDLLAPSLEVFVLSSVTALRFLAAFAGAPRGRLLAAALQLLARSCWSFATGSEESAGVLDAFVTSRGLAPILEHGERAYVRQSERYRELVRRALEDLVTGGPEPFMPLNLGMRRLSYELRDADAAVRRRIGWSQMHMTANRIGLSNAEEVYLGRILERATVDLAAADPAWWIRAWQALGERRKVGAGESLDNLVHSALERQFTGGRATPALDQKEIDGWSGSSAS